MKTLVLIAFLSTNLTTTLQPVNTTGAERENLSEVVNSEVSESRPYITGDGKTLYFCRRNAESNVGGERDELDVYVSYLGANDQWSEPEHLSEPINSKKNNAIAALGQTSSELYVLNTFNFRNIPLYVSKPTADGWGELEPVNVEEYYNESKFVDIHVNEEHGVMLMAVERWEGRGEQDIYVSFRKTGNSWTKPQNLGRKINTRQADFAPFLSKDGRTIFFCSYGHRGSGADIYAARRLDDSWENWTKPVNLGSTVNTDGEEVYFSITDDFEYMYLESFAPGTNNRDIIRTPVPEEVKPPVGAIDPLVIASNNLEEDSTISSFTLADIRNVDLNAIPVPIAEYNGSEEEAVAYLGDDAEEDAIAGDLIEESGETASDGEMAMADDESEIPPAQYAEGDEDTGDTNYVAANENEGVEDTGLADINSGATRNNEDEPENSGITRRPDASNEELNNTGLADASEDSPLDGGDDEYSANFNAPVASFPIQVKQVDGQSQVDYLRNIYFEVGKAEVPENAKVHLDQVYGLMQQDQNLVLKLSGHSDITGSESTNLRISIQRANAAAEYMKKKGISADRIRIDGFGGQVPLASNDDEREGREYNRRVDILLVYDE